MNSTTVARYGRTLCWVAGGGMLLALLVTVGILWWCSGHVRIERRVALPPQGEAAYNPLYLLREALRADGVDAQARQWLQLERSALGPRDTVLILSDPRLLSAGDVEHLLGWVEHGGHLIVSSASLEGTDPRWDFNRRQAEQADPDVNQRRRGKLMVELNLWPHPNRPAHCDENPVSDDLDPLFCGHKRFRLAGELPALALGDPAVGYAFARLRRGAGAVDVLATLDFLTNRQLAAPPRAAFTRQVLAPNYAHGSVHLIYAAQMPPLWQLLLERGPMAWIPLLLALAAWLWLRMLRFGPLCPAPLPARRALLEHVQASGEHLYRYRRGDVLYAAMRAAFLARLARRDLLAAALRGRVQHAAIATRTGIPAQTVAAALSDPPTTARDFCARIACLQQMRHRL